MVFSKSTSQNNSIFQLNRPMRKLFTGGQDRRLLGHFTDKKRLLHWKHVRKFTGNTASLEMALKLSIHLTGNWYIISLVCTYWDH